MSHPRFLNHRVLLVFTFILLGSIHAYRSSPTTDEIGFMAAGLCHWETARFEAFAVNPPLIRMLATLPLVPMLPVTDWGTHIPSVAARPEGQYGYDFLQNNRDNLQHYYFVSRMVCLLLSAVGLYTACHWAGELFGTKASYVVGLLWVFSPMMIAHGSLMTPDAGAASLGTLAFFLFRRWLISCSLIDAFVFGSSVGLALSTKFTWLLVLPPSFVVLWFVWRFNHHVFRSRLRRDSFHIAVAILCSMVVINAMYGFDRTFLPLGKIPFISGTLAPTETQNIQNENRFSGTWMGLIPMPFPVCLLQGIDTQKSSFEKTGQSRSYLMGRWKSGGWWYYYLVGFFVKSPMPVLALGFIACVTVLGLSRQWRNKLWRPREAPRNELFSELMLLALPAICVFVFVSLETGFNRHLRYVLPAYPFVFILISQVVTAQTAWIRMLIRPLLVLQVVSVLWHGPHWLSYFNELTGGPKRGGEWMLVSNVDWGQDFYYLRLWQEKYPEVGPLKVLIENQADLELYGVKMKKIHIIPKVTSQISGWYAVGVNILYGHGQLPGNGSEDVNQLKHLQPTDWAGYSIRIYHVEEVQKTE